jgi:outer membrane protein assembly factor BamE (lipoprotein component of BamABCDE complex)
MVRASPSLLTLLALVALLAGGCTAKVANRGTFLDPDKVAEIKVGQSTREDVATKLGSPTEVSTFDEKIWYYFGRTTEQMAFWDPDVVRQEAYEVRFNDEGTVVAFAKLDPTASRDVDPVTRATPTYGHDMTFMEQLVGNVSRRSSGDKDKK